eukprot:14366065-Alexandrium_andersonii.AAC.1
MQGVPSGLCAGSSGCSPVELGPGGVIAWLHSHAPRSRPTLGCAACCGPAFTLLPGRLTASYA